MARLTRLTFISVVLGFTLLAARSECDSKEELLHYGTSTQDGGAVQWTPDGSKIVFSGGGKIVVAHADGTQLWTIPQGPTVSFPFLEDTYPQVSPDGTRVAYVTYRYSKGIRKEHRDQIATSNLDGSDHRRITSDKYDYEAPAWSPDGTRTAFVLIYACVRGNKDRDGIYIADSTGRSRPKRISVPIPTNLASECSWGVGSPVWSPSGEYIVFYGSVYTDALQRYIAAIRPDGSGYRRIHELSAADAYFLTPVSFSPDGTRLAFVLHQDDSLVVRSVNFDGSDTWDALTIPMTDEMRGGPLRPDVAYASVAGQYIDHVYWSPDGSEIIFSGISEGSENLYDLEFGIHAVAVDGTGLRALVEFDEYDYFEIKGVWPVALSPDGSRFAVLRAPSDLVRPLTGGIRHPDDPWYPDRHDEEKGVILFTVAADGSDSRVLVREVHGAFVPEAPARKVRADDTSACATGRAVQEPEKNPELVRDCEILIEIRDVLAGRRGFLDWNPNRSMEAWHGISVGGSPTRVERISIGRRVGADLRGSLPAALSELDGLKELSIFEQHLTGSIPPSLGDLARLEELRLYGMLEGSPRLSGPIPVELSNLTNLRSLEITGAFIGRIPAELGGLEHLETLVILHAPDLTGCIPASLTSKEDLNIQIYGLLPC